MWEDLRARGAHEVRPTEATQRTIQLVYYSLTWQCASAKKIGRTLLAARRQLLSQLSQGLILPLPYIFRLRLWRKAKTESSSAQRSVLQMERAENREIGCQGLQDCTDRQTEISQARRKKHRQYQRQKRSGERGQV